MRSGEREGAVRHQWLGRIRRRFRRGLIRRRTLWIGCAVRWRSIPVEVNAIGCELELHRFRRGRSQFDLAFERGVIQLDLQVIECGPFSVVAEAGAR